MKTIEILLTANVDNLGIVGDVVKVKPGFARNYLLPHGIAISPTKANIAKLAQRRVEVEAEMKVLRSQNEKLLETLTDLEITLERSANEQGVLFGGVSQHDIAQLLREQGHDVEDRAVRVGDHIKRLDTYDIPITLASDLKTQIKLWVVSDKPAEELDANDAQEDNKDAGTGDQADASGKNQEQKQGQEEVVAQIDE